MTIEYVRKVGQVFFSACSKNGLDSLLLTFNSLLNDRSFIRDKLAAHTNKVADMQIKKHARRRLLNIC
jgi:hypothetical protein